MRGVLLSFSQLRSSLLQNSLVSAFHGGTLCVTKTACHRGGWCVLVPLTVTRGLLSSFCQLLAQLEHQQGMYEGKNLRFLPQVALSVKALHATHVCASAAAQ